MMMNALRTTDFRKHSNRAVIAICSPGSDGLRLDSREYLLISTRKCHERVQAAVGANQPDGRWVGTIIKQLSLFLKTDGQKPAPIVGIVIVDGREGGEEQYKGSNKTHQVVNWYCRPQKTLKLKPR